MNKQKSGLADFETSSLRWQVFNNLTIENKLDPNYVA